MEKIINNLIDMIRIRVESHNRDELLIIIGAVFLGAGFIFSYQPAQWVGFIMIFLGATQ